MLTPAALCLLQMEDFRMVSSRVGGEGGVALAKALAAGERGGRLCGVAWCGVLLMWHKV